MCLKLEAKRQPQRDAKNLISNPKSYDKHPYHFTIKEPPRLWGKTLTSVLYHMLQHFLFMCLINFFHNELANLTADFKHSNSLQCNNGK